MTSTSTVPNFENQWNLPQTPVQSTYMVCATPRTGSNLLCFALAKQGIGMPLEYLNLHGNRAAQTLYNTVTGREFIEDANSNMTGVDIAREYMSKIVRYRTTANGIFGIKVFAHHFTNLFDDADFSTLTQLLETPPKVIHLVRENIIDLTVSYIMAQNSQRWHSHMEPKDARETIYDFEEFFATMKDLNEIQCRWQSILRTHPKDMIMHITYKQLCTDYTETITAVNHFLGVDNVDIPTQPIQKQMSEEKITLVNQFTIDCKRNAKRVRLALKKARQKYQ